MYQLIKLPCGSVNLCCIRKEDGTLVPTTDPANTDYQAYLTWLAEGNTPEPAEGTE
jgi:hypothetical protein